MTTAECIKNIRKMLCVSQAELAKELEVTVSSISCYENGRRMPHYSTIRKIINFAKKNGVKLNFNDIRPE